MTEPEIVYKATIPLDPKTKKNSLCIRFKKGAGGNFLYKRTQWGMQSLGIPFISQNDRYKEYEQNCAYWLRRPKDGPIDYPVNICFTFYRGTRRTVDLCNLQNAILDILTHYHILEDDNRNIVYSMDGSRVFYDKNNPRTEIVITRAEGKKWNMKGKEEVQ